MRHDFMKCTIDNKKREPLRCYASSEDQKHGLIPILVPRISLLSAVRRLRLVFEVSFDFTKDCTNLFADCKLLR